MINQNIPSEWRRAIAQSLHKMTDANGVRLAATFWHENHMQSVSQANNLRQFAKAAALLLKIPTRESEIALNLFNSVNKDMGVLPPDPLPELETVMSQVKVAPQAYGQNTSQTAAKSVFARLDACSETCFMMLNVTHVILSKQAGGQAVLDRIYSSLLSQQVVNALRLSLPQLGMMRQCMRGNMQTEPQLANKADGQKMLNFMYVAMAESLGPVLADKCLTAIMKKTTDTPQGTAFSPEQYL